MSGPMNGYQLSEATIRAREPVGSDYEALCANEIEPLSWREFLIETFWLVVITPGVWMLIGLLLLFASAIWWQLLWIAIPVSIIGLAMRRSEQKMEREATPESQLQVVSAWDGVQQGLDALASGEACR